MATNSWLPDTPLSAPDWNGVLRRAMFTPDLRHLVAGGDHVAKTPGGELWFWDTSTGKLAAKPLSIDRKIASAVSIGEREA